MFERGSAPARPIRALGVAHGESWRRVGITFTVIISLVTAVFLWLAYRGELADVALSSWGLALLVAVPLSVTDALSEELITRWAVVASCTGSWAGWAPWPPDPQNSATDLSATSRPNRSRCLAVEPGRAAPAAGRWRARPTMAA